MKLLLTVMLITALQGAFSQILDVKEAAKRKTENRVNNKTEESIDKGLNKAEEGIGNLFKKKNKKKQPATDGNNTASNNTSGSSYREQEKNQADENKPTDYSVYKDFDFVPGEKILFFEDFKNFYAGTIPKGWVSHDENVLSVKKTGDHDLSWLSIKGGDFNFSSSPVLPEKFTLEMDIQSVPGNSGSFFVKFFDVERNGAQLIDPYWDNAAGVGFSPRSVIPKKAMAEIFHWQSADMVDEEKQFFLPDWFIETESRAKFSMVRNGSKASIYLNQKKLWDNIEFFKPGVKYRMMLHLTTFFQPDVECLITNIRLATNAPEVAKKINESGKFVTNNIYFNTSSAKIKPASYAVLKSIAEMLSENPSYKIQITGHTDSDGEAAANLELSIKRAEAVKLALVNEFGLLESRFTSTGKGEAEPVDVNTNAQGKANNRRVEFIKL